MVLDNKDSFNKKGYIEAKSLKSLLVRPIVAHERNEWDSLMARHHYLGLRGIVGEAMHGQVTLIERITTDLKGQKPRHEIAFGVTSLTPEKATPERLLQLNRGQWSIENKLHYVCDVTFDEDRCRIHTKSAPRLMVTLRNFAISLLNVTNHSNIAKALRLYAAKPHLTLRLFGL